jgi:RNA polymerase sigma-70 factor (ECF subfamily)
VTNAEVRLKALMVASIGGDREAYRRLLVTWSEHLRAYFHRRLHDSAEVEDLVQETLLSLHRKRDTFDPREPFTPWAYAIARYRLLDHRRARRRHASVPLDTAGGLVAAGNVEEGAVRRDLGKLLLGLPGRQRRLVMETKILGYSIEEAAADSGLSPGAAKVSLHRGLKAMRERVRHEDD